MVEPNPSNQAKTLPLQPARNRSGRVVTGAQLARSKHRRLVAPTPAWEGRSSAGRGGLLDSRRARGDQGGRARSDRGAAGAHKLTNRGEGRCSSGSCRRRAIRPWRSIPTRTRSARGRGLATPTRSWPASATTSTIGTASFRDCRQAWLVATSGGTVPGRGSWPRGHIN